MANAQMRQPGVDGPQFADVLTQARPKLERILGRFRIPASDAGDLVQEVAMCLLRKHDEVLDPVRWLEGALRRECLKYWRAHRRRFTEALDETLHDVVEGAGPLLAERLQVRFDLERAFAGLKERCRSLLTLRYIAGCEGPEIAQRLGYSAGSIDKLVRRCVASLGAMLAAPRGGHR